MRCLHLSSGEKRITPEEIKSITENIHSLRIPAKYPESPRPFSTLMAVTSPTISSSGGSSFFDFFLEGFFDDFATKRLSADEPPT